MKDNFCVIMAGGIGSRFWPLSKTSKPKQFLDIMGVGRTFLQLTCDRLKPICPEENFFIVTNEIYKDLVLEQIPFLSDEQVLLEPVRRNTAPCIAYANCEIRKRNKNAKMIVAPADHLILKQDEFLRVLKNGLDFASKNDALLTIGIRPSRPDTGYGYIRKSSQKEGLSGYDEIYKVDRFTEKPNLELAKSFCESGDYLWNSGIFVWSLSSIDNAIEKYMNDVFRLFSSLASGKPDRESIGRVYAASPNISIDYGVMEKAPNVYVHDADFAWSDLGTWGSLYENMHKDGTANAVASGDAMLYDTRNCVVNVPPKKLVLIQGLDGYIVVDSGESLMICKKDEEQRIKQFVGDIQSRKGSNFV